MIEERAKPAYLGSECRPQLAHQAGSVRLGLGLHSNVFPAVTVYLGMWIICPDL